MWYYRRWYKGSLRLSFIQKIWRYRQCSAPKAVRWTKLRWVRPSISSNEPVFRSSARSRSRLFFFFWALFFFHKFVSICCSRSTRFAPAHNRQKPFGLFPRSITRSVSFIWALSCLVQGRTGEFIAISSEAVLFPRRERFEVHSGAESWRTYRILGRWWIRSCWRTTWDGGWRQWWRSRGWRRGTW